MPMDSKEFATGLVQEAHKWATIYVQQTYGRIQEPMSREQMVHWMRSMMWREFKLNDVIIKEMIRLPDEAYDLKHLLSQQVLEEYKHSAVFARLLKEMGEDSDLNTYQPTEEELKLYEDSYKWEHPAELAAALNCSGEVLVSQYLKFLVNPKRPLIDQAAATTIESDILDEGAVYTESLVDARAAEGLNREVIPDEGRHIRNGRMVIERYATTDEMQERCRKAFDTKINALKIDHSRLVESNLQVR